MMGVPLLVREEGVFLWSWRGRKRRGAGRGFCGAEGGIVSEEQCSMGIGRVG